MLEVNLRDLDFFGVVAGQCLQDASTAVHASETGHDRRVRHRIGLRRRQADPVQLCVERVIPVQRADKVHLGRAYLS